MPLLTTKTPLFFKLIMLTLLLLSGCDWLAHKRFESKLRHRQRESEEHLSKIQLVAAQTGYLQPASPGIDIAVTADSVWVDNTSLVAHNWHTFTAEYAMAAPPLPSEFGDLSKIIVSEKSIIQGMQVKQGEVGRSDFNRAHVDEAYRKTLLYPQLRRVLSKTIKVLKQQAERVPLESSITSGNFLFEGAVPYHTIVRVLCTAGQAGIERSHVLLRSSPSKLQIQSKLQASRANLSLPLSRGRMAVAETQKCIKAHISHTSQGILVYPIKPVYGNDVFDGKNANRPCRLIKGAGDNVTILKLVAFLTALNKQHKLAKRFVFNAEPSVPWSNVAPVLEQLFALPMLWGVELSFSFSDLDLKKNCQQALTPEDFFKGVQKGDWFENCPGEKYYKPPSFSLSPK